MLICNIAGYPRSGTHRLRQVVWCLIHQRPFDYPKGFQWLLENGYPFFHAVSSYVEGKTIYIIRNEADVLKSWAKFFAPDCKDVRRPVIEGTWEEAPEKLAEMYKRWSTRENNIKSYIDRPDTLIVHYETLDEQVKDIADFLNLPFNPDIPKWMDFEYKRYNNLLPISKNTHISMTRYEEWKEKF